MTEVVTQPGVLASLGINLKLFSAQLINFAILLIVLWRFVYKPLLKIMNDRSEKIEQGLKNAEEAKSLRKQATSEHAKVLAAAQQEVRGILQQAQEEAQRVQEQSLTETRTEIDKQLEGARQRMEVERQNMMKEMKKDIVHLVVQASEQVLGERIDKEVDEAYIQRVVKTLDRG